MYLECARGLAFTRHLTFDDTGSLDSPESQVVYLPGSTVPSWATTSRFLAGNREAELKPTTFFLLCFRVFLYFLFYIPPLSAACWGYSVIIISSFLFIFRFLTLSFSLFNLFIKLFISFHFYSLSVLSCYSLPIASFNSLSLSTRILSFIPSPLVFSLSTFFFPLKFSLSLSLPLSKSLY